MAAGEINLTFEDGMLFHRMAQLIEGKSPAAALFNGPYYLAEQLGFRKVIDTTFMIAAMIKGTVDPEDVRRYFRALRRAQRDIDLRPELYTHYYKNEFPERFHAVMDTRSWGPGERIVFETYSKEVFEQSFDWIAEHEIFEAGRMGSGELPHRPSRLRRSRALSTLPENAPCERQSWLVCSQPSVLDGGFRRIGSGDVQDRPIVPLTGGQASTGKQLDNAVNLYMRQHGDTVAGKKIEVIVRDDGAIPITPSALPRN